MKLHAQNPNRKLQDSKRERKCNSILFCICAFVTRKLSDGEERDMNKISTLVRGTKYSII
jgi:hypothetical protein